MMHIESTHSVPAHRPFRTVAVVSRCPQRLALDTVLETRDQDLVFVESIANAYSQIKRVAPDIVVLCLSSDDVDGCQVLSMLALDEDTSRIPVRTHFMPGFDGFGASEADIDLERFEAATTN